MVAARDSENPRINEHLENDYFLYANEELGKLAVETLNRLSPCREVKTVYVKMSDGTIGLAINRRHPVEVQPRWVGRLVESAHLGFPETAVRKIPKRSKFALSCLRR